MVGEENNKDASSVESVSVIIVSYNAAAFIAQAIDSALAQTHQPLEILVLDDSTDATPQIVQAYEKSSQGIVQLHRVERVNVSVKRNMGLALAKGQFIAYLDADDIWLPRKTELQLDQLRESPDAVGAYSHYFDFMNQLDDLERRVPRKGTDNPTLHDVLFEQHMSSSTLMMRQSAIGDVRFDVDSPDAEDTLFVADIRLNGHWRLADEPVIAKRTHAAQTSTSHKHRLRNVEMRLRWMLSREKEVGTELAHSMHEELSRDVVGWLESRYWRREFEDWKWISGEIQRICPKAFAKSFLARTRIHPRWVYQLRDLFTGNR